MNCMRMSRRIPLFSALLKTNMGDHPLPKQKGKRSGLWVGTERMERETGRGGDRGNLLGCKINK